MLKNTRTEMYETNLVFAANVNMPVLVQDGLTSFSQHMD